MVVYLSAATAGLPTTVTPSTSGNFVNFVGFRLADDVIEVRPSGDVVEVE